MSAQPSGSARHFNEAVAAYRRGEYERSASLYRAGLALDPTAVAAYLDLAKVCETLGDWDAALDALDRALVLDPDHPTGRRRRERIREERDTFRAIAESLTRRVIDFPSESFDVIPDVNLPSAIIQTSRRALAHAAATIPSTLGLMPPARLQVHLMPATSAARAGLPLWAAGAAQDDRRIVLFLHGRRPDPGVLSALLRHEYAHVLIYGGTEGRCPEWLNEAIATAVAKPFMAWEQRLLDDAVRAGACVSLAVLNRPFMELPADLVGLAYRQCGAIGRELFDVRGTEVVRRLLDGVRRGVDLDRLLAEVLGENVQELERRLFRRTMQQMDATPPPD